MASGKEVADEKNMSVILHKGLTSLWLDEVCTDFEIETDTKTFRCHKVVLASVSDYFRAMFNSGMSEMASNKATFEDISAGTFDMLFTILYSLKQGKTVFDNKTDEDVSELLKVANRFQMKFLEDMCVHFLEYSMTVSNCVERWKTGQLMLCDQVTGMAQEFILENFDSIIKESIFLTLEVDDLLDILSDLNLNVDKEESVWSAIKKWIDFDKDAREKHFMALLKTCCLSEINNDFLVEKIAFEPIVRRNDEASALVQEALSVSKHPGGHGNIELTFRNCSKKQQTLILLCEDDERSKTDGDIIKRCAIEEIDVNVYSIDIWTDRCKSLPPLKGVGKSLACCVHGESLYVVGGRRGTLTRYNGNSQTWKTLSELSTPLQGHTISATDTCMFVMGGKSKFHANNKVYAYSFDTEKWTEAGELMAPVFGASSVAVKGIIYVIGGEFRREPTDCIQTYDPLEEISSILCSLPTLCAFSRSVCRGEFLYIVSARGEVVKVSTETAKCETIASIPHFNRTNFGIDLRNGKLSIFGGKSHAVARKTEAENRNTGYSDAAERDTEEGDVAAERDTEEGDDATDGARSLRTKQDLSSHDDPLVPDVPPDRAVLVVDIKTGEITCGKPLTTGMEVLGCGLLVHTRKSVKPIQIGPHKPIGRKIPGT
ncbi:ectoderm-neural cortex protein 1-like [Dreissena polymorpha]|uniref:BTB domain-containing protein n=1 Tax=Dreissena polymorpha TaxID=45954 RepID=A0A9D3YD53_DREPO|nr:ectoderm-neural cortex protein 1-like [Dreissena polymorpha]XP_052255779.1 ectoderm-neural cortex protein 1-like [Dreissena polymorpha]XP_052255780.1 ectoderm-neural cortex protein 1-like [Dreissena polymorpha]XP_052255781.1 ectoderm-neural cortex protein 1-like [Dreissena polymorpha]XP_052255782.1 ectoderm-neural cortex protein 1-like [Dreissena polymorpha]XP_052255783.1 ectoderm-neural cortex protein 1-like [Dreissena polymorpha]KAH3696961.1 hypothetical protein DPMN_084443 [Dreissena po